MTTSKGGCPLHLQHGEETQTQHMEAPRWFPDELAHAGDEHLDLEYVQDYDRKAGTDSAEDMALFRDLGLNETHTLVDLGAGTGTLALAASPLCRRVIAVDVSAAMLAILKEKAERLGIKNIECVKSGFLTYEHRGESADFVYSRNALHHLPDFWKALALERISSILRPGACCASTISSSPSIRARPSTSSKSGLQMRQNTPSAVGRVLKSRRMSARNTSPSAGFSSRCSSGWASRFRTRATTLRGPTQHTLASRPGNTGCHAEWPWLDTDRSWHDFPSFPPYVG
jgi:ubiquinone/menaquinone biosynthesis C-methylase UbiE